MRDYLWPLGPGGGFLSCLEGLAGSLFFKVWTGHAESLFRFCLCQAIGRILVFGVCLCVCLCVKLLGVLVFRVCLCIKLFGDSRFQGLFVHQAIWGF